MLDASRTSLDADHDIVLSAVRGRCGVSALPRGRFVVTCEGRFLTLEAGDADDLLWALNEVLQGDCSRQADAS